MRYNNIFNLIIEGPDGVGKSTLITGLFDHYKFRYMCYHRGDLSNYIFSKQYGRVFYSTQRGLPLLYIVLTCDKDTLKERILDRANAENWSIEKVEKELLTLKFSDEFKTLEEKFGFDYDIVTVDTTNLSAQEVLNKVISILDEKFTNIKPDENLSSWNKQYEHACKKLHREFKVIDNQPYIDGKPILVESTCHNGAYEEFTDKRVDDNLLYSYAYDVSSIEKEKTKDFHYIINSKILQRKEIFEYYEAINKNHLSCITSNYSVIPSYDNFERVDRIFGREYLEKIAEAKATIYCARDLSKLKLQTARLYEAIIANNIVFVDALSDEKNEILHNIHHDEYLERLLRVEPDTLVGKYNRICEDDDLYQRILDNQQIYLIDLYYELEREAIEK